jgi:hypothetical protein
MSLAKNAYEEILLNKGRECNYKKEWAQLKWHPQMLYILSNIWGCTLLQ